MIDIETMSLAELRAVLAQVIASEGERGYPDTRTEDLLGEEIRRRENPSPGRPIFYREGSFSDDAA